MSKTNEPIANVSFFCACPIHKYLVHIISYHIIFFIAGIFYYLVKFGDFLPKTALFTKCNIFDRQKFIKKIGKTALIDFPNFKNYWFKRHLLNSADVVGENEHY